MSWKDRLKEAAYTSPTGTRVRFDFENVALDVEKRTAAFEFPYVDDAYVQDNGHGSRKYPMRCFFWGDEHDRAAAAFTAALLERGIGRLEHPLYGTFNVIPFGSISRRDDLKDAANQTIIEVTFWTTLQSVYPTSQGNPRSEILIGLDGFDVAASNQFAAATDLRAAVAKANTASAFRKMLGVVSDSLDAASSATADVSREFHDAVGAVNASIDVLVGQPLQLAQQVTNLIKIPARASAGIASRLDGYGLMVQRILSSPAASGANDSTVFSRIRQRVVNDFQSSDLFAMSGVSGSIQSIVENEFTAKPEALAALDSLLSQLDDVVAWRDARYESLSIIDQGDAYQALQECVATVSGYVINVSFTLATERRIVLDRPRTIIDLAAELYGSVDDRLDFLISTNDLSGSEILELPRGRTVVWYG
jgi:prophage DNA circulation protein